MVNGFAGDAISEILRRTRLPLLQLFRPLRRRRDFRNLEAVFEFNFFFHCVPFRRRRDFRNLEAAARVETFSNFRGFAGDAISEILRRVGA